MELAEIEAALKPIDDLWDSHNGPDRIAFSSWHGVGWRQDGDELVISPFATNQEALTVVEGQLRPKVDGNPKIKIKGLILPPFHEMTRGKQKEIKNPFQPGNLVGVSGCICTGTIGAFLTSQKNGTTNTWLLSNHHILAECSIKKIEVLGAGGVTLGIEILPVPISPRGNTVDAAVVKMIDTSKIDPVYEGLGRVTKPTTSAIPNLKKGASARKLGVATGPTFGRLALHCHRVNVFDCTDVLLREFRNQLAFISEHPDDPDHPFADEGDSGSLVISDTRPIGILFAKSIPGGSDPPDSQMFKPPLFLVNRWDLLMKELEQVVQAPLELMLRNQENLSVAGHGQATLQAEMPGEAR